MCLVFVSIPNGSIKSLLRCLPLASRGLFQFQMVRLKAARPIRRCPAGAVSIPNGSIKSRPLRRPDDLLPLFQFQMVRLKVTFRAKALTPSASFNSKWFD